MWKNWPVVVLYITVLRALLSEDRDANKLPLALIAPEAVIFPVILSFPLMRWLSFAELFPAFKLFKYVTLPWDTLKPAPICNDDAEINPLALMLPDDVMWLNLAVVPVTPLFICISSLLLEVTNLI